MITIKIVLVFFIYTTSSIVTTVIANCTTGFKIPPSSTVRSPDYYWRDYFGSVPEDAIVGGIGDDGQYTYVGQAYFEKYQLLPVIITPECKAATTTAYESEITADKNIKILCSQSKESLEWIPTKSNETHLLIDRHLLVGGYEVGHSLNIGRVNHEGLVIVGKVFSHPLPNSGLWIPYKGAPLNFKSYEILTYKTVKPEVGDLDVRFSE